jgi:LacI family transcriptional regulator
MTAIGVIRQAYEQTISVPDELSVVGFDDTRLADYIVPPLTTIQMSQKDLAQIAFQALLEESSRKVPASEGTEYLLTTQFVLRRSTDFPPDERKREIRRRTEAE